jgi:class 3 adenylate cyclase
MHALSTVRVAAVTAELPADPTLAAAARALEAGSFAAEVWDAQWRLAYLTSEHRTLVWAGKKGAALRCVGEHFASSAMLAERELWPAGPTFESLRESLRGWGAYIAATTAGGRDGLLELADPRLRDIFEQVEPQSPPVMWRTRVDVKFGREVVGNDVLLVALHGPDGDCAGYAALVKPEVRAGVLGMLALGNAQLFELMSGLTEPARRPAAVLFGDLEASSVLSRRLSTPAFFALIRRLAHGADRAVVNEGGIVGKHVGDGVTAFFLAEEAGSESTAARACVAAMRAIREVAETAATRSGLDPTDVTMRFGMHWGSTLYVGRLITSGRAEVTALGDEVNEAARIEACATGGKALASKALIERLDTTDATALGLDLSRLPYTPLASLPTASEKARRDAPSIAVCEL